MLANIRKIICVYSSRFRSNIKIIVNFILYNFIIKDMKWNISVTGECSFCVYKYDFLSCTNFVVLKKINIYIFSNNIPYRPLLDFEQKHYDSEFFCHFEYYHDFESYLLDGCLEVEFAWIGGLVGQMFCLGLGFLSDWSRGQLRIMEKGCLLKIFVVSKSFF